MQEDDTGADIDAAYQAALTKAVVRLSWDAAKADFDRKDAAYRVAEETDADAAEQERLSEISFQAYSLLLFDTPCPDKAALQWKIDHYNDGGCNCYGPDTDAMIRAETKRVLSWIGRRFRQVGNIVSLTSTLQVASSHHADGQPKRR